MSAITIGDTAGAARAPKEQPREAEALRRKLRLLLFMRVIVVGFLVAATAVLVEPGDDPASSFASPSELLLLVLGSGVLGLSLGYAIALRVLRRVGHLRLLAHIQLAGDGAFAGVLVFLTGGTSSSFTFFFSVTIVLAAVIVQRRGAFVQATVCALLFLAIGMSEATGATDAEGVRKLRQDTAQPAPKDESEAAAQVSGLIYRLMNNVLAFYAIAFLANYLSESLRRTDIQLEEKSERLDALRVVHDNIVASIPSGLVTLAPDGLVTFANRNALEMAGTLPASEPLTTAWPELGALISEVASGESGRLITVRREDGRDVYLEWQLSTLRDAGGEPIGHLLVVQDVTEVREMQSQVQRAERFATIGKLAASIAHEIRNPLASISGSIQLLGQTTPDEGPNRRLMEIVGRETDALNAFINDFLAYARPQLGSPVEVDLVGLVSDAATVLKQDPKSANIDIQVTSAPGCAGRVMADPTYLRQVVWNLLGNAVQAMPDGGTIEVNVGSSQREGAAMVRLSVSDTGVGIPEEVQGRVFDPFFTTKPDGTGLGLATAYRVVTEYGGAMGFESVPGEGTTFHVDLPAAPAPVASGSHEEPA